MVVAFQSGNSNVGARYWDSALNLVVLSGKWRREYRDYHEGLYEDFHTVDDINTAVLPIV